VVIFGELDDLDLGIGAKANSLGVEVSEGTGDGDAGSLLVFPDTVWADWLLVLVD